MYYLVPFQFKNLVLFIASLIFYAWGEPIYVTLMLFLIGIGYVFGLWIEKNSSKALLTLAITSVVSFLIYFKYADFLIDNINHLLGTSLPTLQLTMPIGISFYTFQMISYLVDVYRGELKAQKSLIAFGTYISMFPQLIAGPIVRYKDIDEQLLHRKISIDQTSQGICRFIIGLSKKVLLANSLGKLCQLFLTSQDSSVLYYWLYALSFSLHIYFDFSGYSDMAIGLGKMLGFHFPENFNYPFLSSSIQEFWQRWHISLGSWFRDYVYIPLGGNRVSKPRWLLNIAIVWLLTGLWHGAAWNFVFWGSMFAGILLLEKTNIFKRLLQNKVFSHLYVSITILISFVIFNAANLTEAGQFIKAMFGLTAIPFISKEFIYYLQSYGMTLIIAIIGATPLAKQCVLKLKQQPKIMAFINLIEPFVLVALLLLVTSYLINDAYNPFLYFRF